jgi:dissimilatory sulfite reductase (desulfoviridin) alpha/beta subunit
MAAACPSSALEVAGAQLRLDLGRCTACGRCLELAQQFGRRRSEALLATRHQESLVVNYLLGDVK